MSSNILSKAMASVFRTNIMITAVLVCWQAVFSSRIEILPVKMDGFVTTSVNITCAPSTDIENCVKRVIGMQISKGKRRIASLNEDSRIVSGTGIMTLFHADGQMSSDVRKSFLRITMPNVLIGDSGEYSCEVYFVDEAGFLEVDTIQDGLVVDDQDIQTHVAYLIKKSFNQEGAIRDQARQLENQTNNLKELEHLLKNEGLATSERLARSEQNNNNKDTHLSVFSASLDPNRQIKEGDVLKFEDILTNKGGGYDETSGLYTAPYQGLYSFHLSMSFNTRGKYSCPGGWSLFEEEATCITFIKLPVVNWNDARKQCNNFGGDLIRIDSQEKLHFFTGLQQDYRVWIGLHRNGDSKTFSWLNDIKLAELFNFYPGQPDDAGNAEDCIHALHPSWKWNDIPCSTKMSYVCEKRASKKGGNVRASIQVKGREVATTNVRESQYQDSSSVSCIVSLEAGDVVRTIVTSVSMDVKDPLTSIRRGTVFSGYLIKAT